MTQVTIRAARTTDAPALTDLYNWYIRETPITFDLEPWTLSERERWLSGFSEAGRYRLRVAERSGELVGYACSRRFRDKAAYDTSVEVSVYLHPEATGQKLGTALYSTLFESLRGEDVHRAIAGITLPNTASIALHERFGFRQVGLMTAVGRKFGRYWDVAWLEKAFD